MSVQYFIRGKKARYGCFRRGFDSFRSAFCWLPLLGLIVLSACAGASAPPTPLPAGMAFDPEATIYEISPASSEARFLIDEILRGELKTVAGVSNQVTGQIALDPANPATAAVGPVQVNASSLRTDNDFRNRAIETRVLLARVFEYVTFTPTAVVGLPATIAQGEQVEFQIEGDLTITDVTRPAVFDASAVLESDGRIIGSASTSIMRDDFNLFVPSATGVAAVDDVVRLEIDFTAEEEKE